MGISVRVRLLERRLWSSAQPRNRLASEGDLEGRGRSESGVMRR